MTDRRSSTVDLTMSERDVPTHATLVCDNGAAINLPPENTANAKCTGAIGDGSCGVGLGTRNVRRILVTGVNAPLPLKAKKTLKI